MKTLATAVFSAAFAPLREEPLGLYVHIPFCERKCPYCDFNTYAGLESQFDDLVDALCLEMARWQEPLNGRQLETIFVGGGTPTVLSDEALATLFEAIFSHFDVASSAEITCEANPGTVDRSKFATLRALGVNRLSMGVQSFQPDELAFLGRIHSVDDVHRAWEKARGAGFDNINLDFIFGLPEQHPNAWEETVRLALDLQPEHLSLYSLIVEENTPLNHWVETGKVAMPDDDEAAANYEAAMTLLGAAGYRHYEVSNWALEDGDSNNGVTQTDDNMPALACRHNLIYWRNQEYLGIGPGAHSHLSVTERTGDEEPNDEGATIEKRWGNHRPVAGYVKRIRNGDRNCGPVDAFSEVITPEMSMGETMMLGLRLLQEGVSEQGFFRRYGIEIDKVFGETLDRLAVQSLIVRQDDHVRLTSRGAMVGNQVFMEFLTI